MDYLKKHLTTICLGAILIASFLLMLFSARTDSIVTDEIVHISAGYLHVFKGNYLFNTEHPPLLNDIAGLGAKIAKPNLPSRPAESYSSGGDQWDYGDAFFYSAGNDLQKVVMWARLPFMLMTMGLIYLVFLWGRALFKTKAGLVAAVLAAFCPNILAHGHLATTDIGLTLFFVLTVWNLRKYILKANWQNAFLLGLSLALVLLSKFSAPAVLPVILAGLIMTLFFERPKWQKFLGHLGLIIFIPLILIWAVYAFSMREYLTHLPPVYEMAKFFGSRTLSSHFWQWLIVPYDKLVQGLQILSDHNTSGHWAYLNGMVDYRGWWGYFPLVLLYKLTLPTLALIFLAIILFKKYHRGFMEEFLIIFTPLLFLFISMIGRIDIGIRHILPMLPFLFIFASRVTLVRNFYLKATVVVLVICQILIGILAFPNYLDYFNQIAGGAKGGLRHLDDSNLDWNQNMIRFADYAKKNHINKIYELCWSDKPFTYYGISNEILPNTPVEGMVVICAQQLMVTPDGFDISWVTKYPPDAVVAGGVYIWQFPKKALQSK